MMAAVLAAPPALAQDDIRVSYPPGAPRIASDFLDRVGVNGGWRESLHQGIDIPGPNGMEVLAAAGGRVLEAQTGPCWGPTIVIDHGRAKDGKRIVAAYGHLGSIDVDTGQDVARGEVIGQLGNSYHKYKCSAGVRHLHFQIGRAWRGPFKGDAWGHVRFLRDGRKGVNPHLYWSRGEGRVTCFEDGILYNSGTLTYPVACRGK